MNWTSRGSLLGGIYNRPVGMADLVHFFVGSLALAKGLRNGWSSAEAWIVTAIYVAFAAIGIGARRHGTGEHLVIGTGGATGFRCGQSHGQPG